MTKNIIALVVLGVLVVVALLVFREKPSEDALKAKETITITIKVGDLVETVKCQAHPGFMDSNELVIRKTEFKSRRTAGTKADKASADLNRELLNRMKEPSAQMEVIFS